MHPLFNGLRMGYPEYKQLNLPLIGEDILSLWEEEKTFEKSITSREGKPAFVFYEGPPSANGLPGIHHVMARSIKDIFCRYKTLKGFQVKRKGGWDTHGLPIELSVEKKLHITKEDIGKTISVEDYNKECRREVMKFTDVWDDLTRKMGYWVDLEHPYITYENKYIESVWYLLSMFYSKDLLYKGYSIQPYSPAAGTGLSSHELNQPGCYRPIKDTTVVAQFELDYNTSKNGNSASETSISKRLWSKADPARDHIYFLAWTTTPWTLPANCALAVGAKIDYVLIKTYNPYTFKLIHVILAKDLVSKFFPEKNATEKFEDYREGAKVIPYAIIDEFSGASLEGLRYHQLMPYVKPEGKAFEVILGDFVSTEDGTGIVHTASVFGADDFRVCSQNNIASVLVPDENGKPVPIVDRRGRFVKEVTDFAGEFVKEEYLNPEEKEAERLKQGRDKYLTVDERIAIKLKQENKAFKVEKYEHNYPHCWRTDKPVLYYPLDSWFIRTTACKEKLISLNKTINWKPESTGSGRFGNWLENLVDWNLSRSRFWGIPLPIWTTEDKTEQLCIRSVQHLREEADKAVSAGMMKSNPVSDVGPDHHTDFDLHRPYVDDVFLVSPSGKKMVRETDLIDVWFDSGAMPYAQYHYMGKEAAKGEEGFGSRTFPADFIAEGVDQTRGWFFTLHAIAVMLFDSVAFKNVVSNGLVLDKNGNKMSKRLGNAVDPFKTIQKYGADATRWYLISNAQPWDNLKFNEEGITDVQRKFFGTLFNTYSFFALYANIDGFVFQEPEIPLVKPEIDYQEGKIVRTRPEIDRWILSELHSLIKFTDECYADYEPTRAARAIQDFVSEHLSNWYVRLSRRRFWSVRNSDGKQVPDADLDKIAAYQTLYFCLETISVLISPIAPFFADRLFRDLNMVTKRQDISSVHLAEFPVYNEKLVDKDLEERMEMAQKISSMVLSLRKKVNIRVRQPLEKILLPVIYPGFQEKVETVRNLILSEVNVKEIQYITDTSGILVKKIKPNFKVLGKKVGPLMKDTASAISAFTQADIAAFEKNKGFSLTINGQKIQLVEEDAEILSEDIAGWEVASDGMYTVALDITINQQLREEGIAREIINRIQNFRKEKGFEVTDRISVKMESHEAVNQSISNNLNYICTEILASSLEIVEKLKPGEGDKMEVDNEISLIILINKV